MYDIILTHSLRYSDIVKKICSHISYHIAIMISCMISYLFDNIIVILTHLPIPCAIFYDFAHDIIYISYKICYDISILWYDSWHQSIYAIIRPPDISNFWYHSHVISRISWYVCLYHCACTAGWRVLGAPAASGLAVANVLGSQWGLLFSWTATVWIPRMDLLQSL